MTPVWENSTPTGHGANLVDDLRDGIADEVERVETVLRALTEVIVDEFNVLRALHSLPDRTLRQVRNAVRAKLNG